MIFVVGFPIQCKGVHTQGRGCLSLRITNQEEQAWEANSIDLSFSTKSHYGTIEGWSDLGLISMVTTALK